MTCRHSARMLRKLGESVRTPGLRPYARTPTLTAPADTADESHKRLTAPAALRAAALRAERNTCSPHGMPGGCFRFAPHPPALPGALGAGAPKPSRIQGVGPHPFGARPSGCAPRAASGPGLRPPLIPSSLPTAEQPDPSLGVQTARFTPG